MDAIDRVAEALDRGTRPGDAVVSHESIDLAAACRLRGRRVVAALHSVPEVSLNYLPAAHLRTIADRVDHWVTWGSLAAGRLADQLKVGPERITVSGQCVEPDDRVVRRLPGSPACLTVARVDPVKNHGLILDALAVLARRMPGIRWHMVGPSVDDAHLHGLLGRAARLGVDGMVTWHGSRDDVAAVMLGSDVSVLTSHAEGLPRATQEAMALGVPTVMPAALVRDLTHAGLPVTYEGTAPEAVAAAVETALRVAPERRAAAASWVRRTWSWERVLADWAGALADGTRDA
ncbi:hypothetical protein GCM10009530_06830 [Microbispora corallina]|uniref:Glycosyl transferase family 1 domain-containing protein n=1 Tax=Microbispora corallina TaxID=83302 RepID=A0ABQ4FV46_9ACTN|nr:hypothetical protein Mco01_16460 [Microbispora corallina]